MNTLLRNVILQILSAYQGLSVSDIVKIIRLTDEVGGVSFVSIKGYKSDKSGNTEAANHLVNIGASYANILRKDAVTLDNIDLSKIDIERFNYDSINLDKLGLTLDEYKKAVRGALPEALEELKAPKEARQSNDIKFNKVLWFNTNTLRLSIFGQSLKKEITEKGEYKKVASAPKTTAKALINQATRQGTLRRFALDNITAINLRGDTVEFETESELK